MDAASAEGDVVVDMKHFTASSKPPARVCRDAVATTEVYVLIVGFCYGTPVRRAEPQIVQSPRVEAGSPHGRNRRSKSS